MHEVVAAAAGACASLSGRLAISQTAPSPTSALHTFHVWKDMAVHLGPGFPSSRHRHFPVQLFLALDGQFLLRSRPSDAWCAYTAAAVPSNVWHQFEAQPKPLAMIYLDPLSPMTRELLGVTARSNAITAVPSELATPLVEELRKAGDRPQSMREAIESLVGKRLTADLRRIDERVASALEVLRSQPARLPSLHEIAANVGLSPQRFRHVFRQQTGITFSGYRLWNRVVHATRLLASTADLTWAAHASGFSDSAHFSRTFHLAFGLKPSEIFKSGRFRLVLCD
jgi:AraC-like DNA-binding protein